MRSGLMNHAKPNVVLEAITVEQQDAMADLPCSAANQRQSIHQSIVHTEGNCRGLAWAGV